MRLRVIFLLLCTCLCILTFRALAQSPHELLAKTHEAIDKARESQKQGQADEALWYQAISAAEMLLAEDFSQTQALFIIAEAYEVLGLLSQAQKKWHHAWLETDNPIALQKAKMLGKQLAEASLLADFPDAAQRYYLALLELDAKDPGIYQGLANLAQQQGELAKAEHYLGIAQSLEPGASPLNHSAFSSGKPSGVSGTDSSAQTANLAKTATNTPKLSLESSYPAEAVAAYQEALQLYESGQVFEARLQFITAIELAPDFKEAWLWVARTRFEQDSFDLAVQAYQRALALDPDNPVIQEQLARAKARQ